jgi:capsular polysaccharide biosynthesis protein
VSTAIAEYAGVLRARWRWGIWGVILALATTTVLLILQPPMYRSDATVFIRTPGDVSTVIDGGDSYARGRAGTYAVLARGTSLSARVITDLGLDLEPEVLSTRITAANPRGTALINIAVEAPTAEQAKQTATVLLSEYADEVRTLESVPGSLVPRAELVVVDPPGRPVQVVAWGVSIPVVLLGSALIGLVIGSAGAVLRSIFEPSRQIAGAPEMMVTARRPEPRSVRIRDANEGDK